MRDRMNESMGEIQHEILDKLSWIKFRAYLELIKLFGMLAIIFVIVCAAFGPYDLKIEIDFGKCNLEHVEASND